MDGMDGADRTATGAPGSPVSNVTATEGANPGDDTTLEFFVGSTSIGTAVVQGGATGAQGSQGNTGPAGTNGMDGTDGTGRNGWSYLAAPGQGLTSNVDFYWRRNSWF